MKISKISIAFGVINYFETTVFFSMTNMTMQLKRLMCGGSKIFDPCFE